MMKEQKKTEGGRRTENVISGMKFDDERILSYINSLEKKDSTGKEEHPIRKKEHPTDSFFENFNLDGIERDKNIVMIGRDGNGDDNTLLPVVVQYLYKNNKLPWIFSLYLMKNENSPLAPEELNKQFINDVILARVERIVITSNIHKVFAAALMKKERKERNEILEKLESKLQLKKGEKDIVIEQINKVEAAQLFFKGDAVLNSIDSSGTFKEIVTLILKGNYGFDYEELELYHPEKRRERQEAERRAELERQEAEMTALIMKIMIALVGIIIGYIIVKYVI